VAQLCFITTCMGRLSFLKQTLPRLVAQPESTCVVVDYSCPERCGAWVEATFPQVLVIRIEGETLFNLGRASNAGIRAAETPWLCCIDCDILIDPHFVHQMLPQLQRGHYYRADCLDDAGVWGTFLCERQTVLAVGSYDEVYQGWGDLDVDLYTALDLANVKKGTFPATLIHHLPHDNTARTRFFEQKDRRINWLTNRFYRIIKFDLMRLRGTPLPQSRRVDLYRRITALVRTTLTKGGNAEMTVTCAVREQMLRDVSIERLLKYTLRLKQPPH
jgi:glycosyltransferase involved in cell wall biosynthesis